MTPSRIVRGFRAALRLRLIFWGVLAIAAFPAACGSSGVVGGECRAGYLDCDGQCVDSQNDANNCGGCSKSCDKNVACAKALCGGDLDGSAGSSSAGASGSAGSAGSSGAPSAAGAAGAIDERDGSPFDGPDAGDGDLSDAMRGTDSSCLPPYDRAEACGDCATQCTGDTPLCSPDGMGSFVCVKQCDPPLTLCGNQCVDLNIDPLHCGSCGNMCPSGICQKGMCVGANVGHVVLSCMDYQQPVANSPQTVLMGNAIFLPVHNPVRILAYTEYASPAVRNAVNADVGYAATARGRKYVITPIDAYADVTAKLNINDFDAFLIYDQSAAPKGQLATVGAAWQTSTVLSSFASAGGVILGLDGAAGTGEMDTLFSAAELLDVSTQTDSSGATLYNRAPADALGVNVISPFLSQKNTCTFTTSVTPDADTIFVIRDAAAPADGSPVVVHLVIEPP